MILCWFPYSFLDFIFCRQSWEEPFKSQHSQEMLFLRFVLLFCSRQCLIIILFFTHQGSPVGQAEHWEVFPSKWRIVLASNFTIDDTLNLLGIGCCGVVSTLRFGSSWRVLRAWPWKVPRLSNYYYYFVSCWCTFLLLFNQVGVLNWFPICRSVLALNLVRR